MSTLVDVFTDIGDAIREKEGSTGVIPVMSMADRIRAIQTGSNEISCDILIGNFADTETMYVYMANDGTAITQKKISAGIGYKIIEGVKVGDVLIAQTKTYCEIVEDDCNDVIVEDLDGFTFIVVITGTEALFAVSEP